MTAKTHRNFKPDRSFIYFFVLSLTFTCTVFTLGFINRETCRQACRQLERNEGRQAKRQTGTYKTGR